MNKTDIRCANCGNTLNENQKFCGRCGAPVSSGEPIGGNHCTRCGNELNKGAMFCNKCGSPVNSANFPVAAKKGISKKALGIIASVVVVSVVGIAVAVGSGDSGNSRNKKSERTSINSIMTESGEKGGNTAGVQKTGTYTISEYINSGNRLILYRLEYEEAKGEYGISRSGAPEKDEFSNQIYVFENGKMTEYYCKIRDGEGLNSNLLYFKELAQMTDDEIIKALNERYEKKYESDKVTISVFTDGTGNSVEYESITAPYKDEKNERHETTITLRSEYFGASGQTYDSKYTTAIGKSSVFAYRSNDLTLTLDGLDSKGVIIDP